MTDKMKRVERIITEMKETEAVLKLLQSPLIHISVEINKFHVQEVEGVKDFIRERYELKKKRLEEEWEDVIE